MIEGVRNLMALGVPLPDALQAAAAIPARIAGRPDLGRLVPGSRADVVVLDDRTEVVRVLVDGGERVAR
jgi:N-acetylglucosamine-6-phosphate deacetylase